MIRDGNRNLVSLNDSLTVPSFSIIAPKMLGKKKRISYCLKETVAKFEQI